MSRYWIFQPWPSGDDYEALTEHCSLLNAGEVFNARQPSGTLWRDFPIARLRLQFEGFCADCFTQEGYTFVSKRLRSAMALPAAAAQFFDVDLSQASGSVRACDYKIMSVSTLEDAIDQWNPPALTSPNDAVLGFGKAFRQDFRPTYEAFHDRTERGFVFCTDALAMRVLSSGCSSARFFNPASYQFRPTDTFRTLRGIERENWETSSTELVEAIA